jgi:hypothetical protein
MEVSFRHFVLSLSSYESDYLQMSVYLSLYRFPIQNPIKLASLQRDA